MSSQQPEEKGKGKCVYNEGYQVTRGSQTETNNTVPEFDVTISSKSCSPKDKALSHWFIRKQ